MNSIFTRRSIRNFLDKEVEQEKIEKILRVGMQAPSAWNFMPWEFIVVRDKDILNKISKMSPYAIPAANSNVAIIALANTKLVEKDNLWFQQDLAACIENMSLQATEENLGSVWLGFYPEKNRVNLIKEFFELPEHIIPFAVVALGYSNSKNIFVDKFDSSKISYEKYLKKY